MMISTTGEMEVLVFLSYIWCIVVCMVLRVGNAGTFKKMLSP